MPWGTLLFSSEFKAAKIINWAARSPVSVPSEVNPLPLICIKDKRLLVQFHCREPAKGGVCMYQTILVPLDLSHPEQASKALGIARRMWQKESRIVSL